MVVVANVLGGLMTAPQAVRLLRTRSVEGVSGTWAGVGVAMNLWWFSYGVANGVWAVVPVSVAATALYATVAALYVRELRAAALPGLAFGVLGLGVVPLPFLVFGGWEPAGLAIGLSYGVQFTPAVLAAMRSRNPVGVSAGTWLMAWVEAAIWLGYSLTIDDVALLAGGASGLLMATLILGRLAQIGRLAELRLRRAVRFSG